MGFKEEFVFIEKASVVQVIKYLKKNLNPPEGTYIMLHGDSWLLNGRTSTVKLLRPVDLNL